MIRITLSEEERLELRKFRRHASSKDSEKALMVLMNDEGKSAPKIAKVLKRTPGTVLDWIKRYKEEGLKGLERKYSPGRPANKRDQAKNRLKELLTTSPEKYGYTDTFWTTGLLMHDLEKNCGEKISEDTISRALHDMGFSYKRSGKRAPTDTISDKEKQMAFKKMLSKVKDLTRDRKCEIYAVDESHFSTTPYLSRGWFLKRKSAHHRNPQEKSKPDILRRFKSEDKEVLLEEVKILR